MPEGANWGMEPPPSSMTAAASAGSKRSGLVNFEVTVTGSEFTGIVQFKIEKGDTFPQIAAKLADEWNARKPIALHAQAQDSLTAFFLEEEGLKLLGKGKTSFAFERMAVTFPEEPRSDLDPTAIWEAGGVRVTRVGVNVAAGTAVPSSPSPSP